MVTRIDQTQRDTLDHFRQKGVPVTLKNCLVKLSRFSNKYEVVLKGKLSSQEYTFTWRTLIVSLGNKCITLSERIESQ